MGDSQFAPGKYPTVGTYPIEPATTSPMFPPVKYSSHWDPTAMLRRIVPQQQVPVPLPFRPLTKICMSYVTAGTPEFAPAPPADMVFPSGGEFYPPNRYAAAIDDESALRRIDRPLGVRDSSKYAPPIDSDMYTYKKITVPRPGPDAMMISELEMPRALIRDSAGGYHCRQAADAVALAATAGTMFGHATKQAKYRRGAQA